MLQATKSTFEENGLEVLKRQIQDIVQNSIPDKSG